MRRSTRRLLLAASACSAIALACAVPGPPANARSAAPVPSASGNQIAGQVVAYRGKGNAVYANMPSSSRFHSLGGNITGAPAVAWASGQFFFVADTKHGIKVRTFTTKWSQLVKGGFTCSQPDLTSNGKRLGLACLHHHALYAAKFSAPSHGVPSLPRLHLQGGSHLTIGSGAFYQGKLFAFELIAQVYEDDDAHWNSHYAGYGKPPLDPGGSQDGDDAFFCRAQATASSAPKRGRVYTGCAIRHKTYYVLSIVTDAGGVCPVMPTAHIANARVGIAPTAKNAAVAVYRTPSGSIGETSMTIVPPAIDCGRDTDDDTVIATGAKSGPSIALGADGYR